MFDYKKLFNEKMQLTTQVERHLTFPTIQKESLAEHLVKVSEKAFNIGYYLFKDKENWYKMEHYGLIHDLPETQTSDIPSGVKHCNPDLNEILEKIEKETMKKYYPNMYNDFCDLLKHEKNKDIFGVVLKICDLLDLLEFIYMEEQLGNKHKILLLVKERAENKINRKFKELLNILIKEENNPDTIIKEEIFTDEDYLKAKQKILKQGE